MLTLQWLGINAFRFEHDGRVVLLDPYVTRDQQRLCDPETVRRYVPQADAIVVSHSHWDHLADTPALALHTGAVVVGSRTTCNVCRAFGVPDRQLVEIEAREPVALDGLSVRFLPSLHMALTDGKVAYAGTYESPPSPAPATTPEFLEGGTFAVEFDFGVHRVLDIGSANLIDDELRGLEPRTLLLGLGGWQRTERYLERVFDCVSPKRVVPCHYDRFDGLPLDRGLEVADPDALAAFERDTARLAPDVRICKLALLETLTLENRS